MKFIIQFIKQSSRDDVVGTAAKTAFFFLLALFPLALLSDRVLSYTGGDLGVLEGFLPGDLLEIFQGLESPLSLANPAWLLGTLWAASSGMLSLMRGVGQAYNGQKLPFVKARGMALGFTLGFLVLLALTFALLASARRMLGVAVGGAVFLLLFALYTLTPGVSVRPVRAAWTAALAAGAWLLVSRGFEVYMRYFSNHSALYGSIGVFMGIAIWVFLISLVVIIGAELGGYRK
jgi:membrane protein